MSNQNPAPGKIEAGMGIGILQAADMAAGKVNIAVVEQDFGAATAVATKIIDSAEVDGEVLAAFFILTEVVVGSTNAGQTWLALAAAGTTEMSEKTAEFAVSETTAKNVLAAVSGAKQHGTEGNRQFDRGEDVYVYTEAETSRSAGKYWAVLLWKER